MKQVPVAENGISTRIYELVSFLRSESNPLLTLKDSEGRSCTPSIGTLLEGVTLLKDADWRV